MIAPRNFRLLTGRHVLSFAVAAVLVSGFLSCGGDVDVAVRERTGLFPIVEDGKWGLIDRKGATKVETRYDWIGHFRGGIAAARIGNSWEGTYEFIDRNGNVQTGAQPFTAEPSFSDGLAPIRVGERMGYLDLKGTLTIPASFDGATAFSEGLAAVAFGDSWGYIDTDGQTVVNPQFEGAGPFSEGRAAIRLGGRWGYLDREGKVTINPQFDWADEFRDGRAIVSIGGKAGLIDGNGRYVANATFEAIHSFHEGLAPAASNGKWGFIDRDGVLVIPHQFDDVPASGPRQDLWILPWAQTPLASNDPRAPRAGFQDGLAVVVVGGRYGAINRSGQYVITPQFEGMSAFRDGLAAVKLDGKYGYIDRDGLVAVTPQFESAASFSEGRAAVRLAGRWGYIDRSGRFAVNPQYDEADDFFDGVARVYLDGQSGYIDQAGAYVRPLTSMFAKAPEAVATALDQLFPGWKYDPIVLEHELAFYGAGSEPHYVSGDFDGIGSVDYAVRIRLPGTDPNLPGRLVVLLAADTGFRSFDIGVGQWLGVVAAGTQVTPRNGGRPFPLAYDAIETGFFEKSASIYQYRNGGFQQVVTSD